MAVCFLKSLMSTRAAKTTTIRIPRLISYLFSLGEAVSPRPTSSKFKLSFSGPSSGNPPKKINWKKVIPVAIVLIAAGLTLAGLGRVLTRVKPSSPASDGRVTVAGAKATNQLNQEFSFPIKDSTGKKITDMKFFLETAELRDEIIVQGKRAVAIKGRTFLVLTFKISNNFTRSLEINTKNYFRLTVNGKESDLLAPDIHNDPVVIQPTSTKYTRIGWPLYDTDSSLTLLVGEIEGDKTRVELGLQ